MAILHSLQMAPDSEESKSSTDQNRVEITETLNVLEIFSVIPTHRLKRRSESVRCVKCSGDHRYDIPASSSCARKIFHRCFVDVSHLHTINHCRIVRTEFE